MERGSAILIIIACLVAVIPGISSQTNQGWENAPSPPTENGEALNPLHSVLAMVRFECAGRAGGYYGDMDFGCSVFHYCASEGKRFTFKCTDGLKFNEETVSCSAAFFGDCSHPEILGSAGLNMTANPAPVNSFQKAPVFMKSEEDRSNDDPRDYPDGFIQHNDPALEHDFEEYSTDNNQADFDVLSLEDSQTSSSINHVNRLPENSIREVTDLDSKSVLSAFASLTNLPLDNKVSGTARMDRYQQPIDRAFNIGPPRRHHQHRNSILRPIPFVGGISKKKPGRVHPPQYNNAGINLIPIQPPHPYNTFREGDIQLSLNTRPELQNSEYFITTTTKPFRPSELITESRNDLNAVTSASNTYDDQVKDNFIHPDAEAGDHIRPYRDANAQTGGGSSFQRFSSGISSNNPNGGFQLHTTQRPRVFQPTTKNFLNRPVFPPSGNFVYNQPPIHPSSPLFNKNTFLHTFSTGSSSPAIQPIQSTHPNVQPIHPPTQHNISPPTFSRFQPPRPVFHVTPPPFRNTPVSHHNFHHDHLNQPQFQDERFTTHGQINPIRPQLVSSHETTRPEVQSTHFRDHFAQTFNPNAVIQFNPLQNQQFEVEHQEPTFNHGHVQLQTNPFFRPHSDNSFIHAQTGHHPGQSNEDHQSSQFAENPHHLPRHEEPKFSPVVNPALSLQPGQPLPIQEQDQFAFDKERFEAPVSSQFPKQSEVLESSTTSVPRHRPATHQFTRPPHRRPVNTQFNRQPLNPQFNERHEPTSAPSLTSTQPSFKAPLNHNSNEEENDFRRPPHRRPVNNQFNRQPHNPQFNERHEPTFAPSLTETQLPFKAPLNHNPNEEENDFRRPVNHQFNRQPLNPQLNGRHEPTSAPSFTATQPSFIAPLNHNFNDEENDFSNVPKFVEDHRITTTPHHHVTRLENSDLHRQVIQPNHRLQGQNIQENNVPLLVDENTIQDESDNDQFLFPTVAPHVFNTVAPHVFTTVAPHVTVLDFTGFRQSNEEFDSVPVMPHELSPIPVLESELPLLTDTPLAKDENVPQDNLQIEPLEEETTTFKTEDFDTLSSVNNINDLNLSKSTSTRLPAFTRGSQRPIRRRTRPTTQRTTIAPTVTTSTTFTKDRESATTDSISKGTPRVRTTTTPRSSSIRNRLNRFRNRNRISARFTTTSSTTTVVPLSKDVNEITTSPRTDTRRISAFVSKNNKRITPAPRSSTTRRVLATDRFKSFRNRLKSRNNKSTTESPSTSATLEKPSDKENLKSNLHISQTNSFQIDSEENILQVKEIIKKPDNDLNDLVKGEEVTQNESFNVQQENESEKQPQIEDKPASRPMDNPDVRARFREFLKNRRNRLSARFKSTVTPNLAPTTTSTPDIATDSIKNIVTEISKSKTEIPVETSTMIVKERMNIPSQRPHGGRRRVLVARKLIQDKNGETRIARRIIPGGRPRPLRNRVIPTIGSKNFKENLSLDDKEIKEIDSKTESKVDLDSSVISTSEKTFSDSFSLSPSTLSAEFVPRPFHLPAQAIKENREMIHKTKIFHQSTKMKSEIEIITAPPQTFLIQVNADLSGGKNPMSSLGREDIQKKFHDSKLSKSNPPLEDFSTPDVLDNTKKVFETTMSTPLASTIEAPKDLFEHMHFKPFERKKLPIIEFNSEPPSVEFSTTTHSVSTTSESSKTTLAKLEKFQFKRHFSSRKESQPLATPPPFISLSQTTSPSDGKTTLADLVSGSKPRFQRPSKAFFTTTEQNEPHDIEPLDSMFIIPPSSNMKKEKSDNNNDSNHNKPSLNRADHHHSRPSFSFDIFSKKNKNDSPAPISLLDISEEIHNKKEENVTPMPFLTITMATDSPFLPLEMLWDFKR